MNFLAHAYLSFNNEGILLGNMISDFVKGKATLEYPIKVQKGIELHRKIDAFTDAHEQTKLAKQFFKPNVGLYAGAFMDVVYDYFLANDLTYFSNDIVLKEFAEFTYTILEKNKHFMPLNFERVMPSMRANNWLYNYKFDYGVQRSFEGLYRRAKFLNTHNNDAYSSFILHKEKLGEHAKIFLKDVVFFVKRELSLC